MEAIELRKAVSPASDRGTFDLSIDAGATNIDSASGVGDGGTRPVDHHPNNRLRKVQWNHVDTNHLRDFPGRQLDQGTAREQTDGREQQTQRLDMLIFL